MHYLDGKVKNYWAGTNNFTNCYLCGCGEKDLRKRHCDDFSIKNLDALKYGFSPLHCELRSFEWFLKNKTYCEVQNYAAFGEENQESVATQKILLQRRFKKYFKLKIFMPKQGGLFTYLVIFLEHNHMCKY